MAAAQRGRQVSRVIRCGQVTCAALCGRVPFVFSCFLSGQRKPFVRFYEYIFCLTDRYDKFCQFFPMEIEKRDILHGIFLFHACIVNLFHISDDNIYARMVKEIMDMNADINIEIKNLSNANSTSNSDFMWSELFSVAIFKILL